MQTKLQDLAQQLIECRGTLQELEERQRAEREPYEQANQVIREKLLDIMSKASLISTKYEDFAISRKTSKKAVITNDNLALATLKELRPEYVIESIAPQALKEIKRTDFSLLLAHKQREPSQVVWFYQNREPSVGGYTLDDETIGLATWPVIDWKYGLDGSVLWECCFAGPSKNVWVDPNNTVSPGKQVHNLAALVMYPTFPGRPGIDEPVASIRLKSFRRGAQDYEYLRLLEKVAGRNGAATILNSVMGECLHRPNRPYGAAGDWSHNPEDWNRMRLRILQALGPRR